MFATRRDLMKSTTFGIGAIALAVFGGRARRSSASIIKAGAKSDLRLLYEALPDEGGVIELHPGARYDVGDGLVVSPGKRVGFYSPCRGTMGRNHPNTRTSPTIFSSEGAPVLVQYEIKKSNVYGTTFDSIDFEMQGGDVALFMPNVNMMEVNRCGFFHSEEVGPNGPPFVALESWNSGGSGAADDSSWNRISNNYCHRGQLINALGPYQHNNWVVRENVCFGVGPEGPRGSFVPGAVLHSRATQSPETRPCIIYMRGAHRTSIRDNNLEGRSIGLHLYGSWGCHESADGGEATSPFILVEKSYALKLEPIGISYPGQDGVLVEHINCADVFTLTASCTGMANLYNNDVMFLDDAPEGNRRNWQLTPSTHKRGRRHLLTRDEHAVS